MSIIELIMEGNSYNKESQMDHHFIPQFFLKEWEDEDSKIIRYFKNKKGEIIEDKKNKKDIGYKKDLYKLNSHTFFPIKDSHTLERNFFQQLDNDSALVKEKIIMDNGFNSLSENEKNTWSKFIHSLIERTPKQIEFLKSESIRIGNKYKEKLSKDKINKNLTIKELGEKIFTKEFIQNESLGLLKRIIEDIHWNQWFCNILEWKIVVLPENVSFFIIGDNPIIKNYGVNSTKIFSVALAISPRLLFLAYEKEFEFTDDFISKFVIMHNLQIIMQSDCLVFSKYGLKDTPIIKYEKAMLESLRPIVIQKYNDE